MTKNERIAELENTLKKVHEELAELRLLNARLATRIGYLENEKIGWGPKDNGYAPVIPQWIHPVPTPPYVVTCKSTSHPAEWPFTTGDPRGN